jgi:hypothetical protein
MQRYKITIARGSRSVLDQEASLSSDYTAIRRATHMASPGDTVSVWRANECIFLSEELAGIPGVRGFDALRPFSI